MTLKEEELNKENGKADEALAKTVGLGTVYITAAKLYFMISGYGIYFVLPRLLNSEQFGVYGFITGVVSIINTVIVTGTQQTVSKFVSQDVRSAEAIKRMALKLQCLMGGGITICYFLAAPLIARSMHDNDLIGPLRISALIPISYSFYAVFLGYLNGQKKFLRQSIIDISYSTLKLISIIGLALLMHNVAGAILGFGVAATFALALSPLIAGRAQDQQEIKPLPGTFLKFQATLLGFMLVSTLLQRTDLILIKRYISTDSQLANKMAGYYTALMAIANITYQAIISITFIIFPLISKATFQERADEVKHYIRQTTKYTLMIMALSATIFSSNAALLLGVLYRAEYRAGAPALAIAAYGMLCFGLIYIFTTIISSQGKPRISLLIGLGTLLASIIANRLLIPDFGITGAALATSLAMALGAIAGGIYIYATCRAGIEARSLLMIAIAAAIIYPIGSIGPQTGLLAVIAKSAGQSFIYLLIMLVTRELTIPRLKKAKQNG